MDINELREHIHLSASGISDYSDCGLLYKFGRIDRLEAEFTSDALLFGTAVHAVLAQFYQELLTGEKMTAKVLTELFADIWKNIACDRDDIRYSNGKSYEMLLLGGKELLSVYYNSLPDEEYTIFGIEEPFSFTVPGVPVPIIGVYDMLLTDSSGVVIIVDHKTTSRSFSNDEVDKNFQMSIYNLSLRRNGYADKEILLRLDCLVKTRTPKFAQYYTTRSEEDEIRTIKKIQQVWDGIKKEVYVPNETSWKCKNCSFKNACNEWFLQLEQ